MHKDKNENNLIPEYVCLVWISARTKKKQYWSSCSHQYEVEDITFDLSKLPTNTSDDQMKPSDANKDATVFDGPSLDPPLPPGGTR